MFINEFYAKFMSRQERSRLFEALRRVSRLEAETVVSSDTGDPRFGWPEWPPMVPGGPGLEGA